MERRPWYFSFDDYKFLVPKTYPYGHVCLQSTLRNPLSKSNNPRFNHEISSDLAIHESLQIIEASDLADPNIFPRIGDSPSFEDFKHALYVCKVLSPN